MGAREHGMRRVALVTTGLAVAGVAGATLVACGVAGDDTSSTQTSTQTSTSQSSTSDSQSYSGSSGMSSSDGSAHAQSGGS
ncbi:hypothetical protein FPZ12_034145 [Amycolatopsis acidicola]|uniref:Uncharacterized protein n=1 Tax=Amycolatopsis acidicola TaxID=2596893 RepID=A0A5N0USB1_9PSEU|nr:hypothetical protein [Amycolatopsis acidicola]KAA9153622.1 hypothetical protein FPZ12_034145 [Amycolatopsis acidicola]